MKNHHTRHLLLLIVFIGLSDDNDYFVNFEGTFPVTLIMAAIVLLAIKQ